LKKCHNVKIITDKTFILNICILNNIYKAVFYTCLISLYI